MQESGTLGHNPHPLTDFEHRMLQNLKKLQTALLECLKIFLSYNSDGYTER